LNKKIGELWSTNTKDYASNIYPQIIFSEGHILAHRECCAPKFLQVLENDQAILAHPSSGIGASFTFFSKTDKKLA